jgi:hypothetical protein
MKPRVDHPPAGQGAFAGDLHSRLEAVRGRVDSEMMHLDQVAAVAASYIMPMPLPLKLVR